MKDRPDGFLSNQLLNHDSEQFDYITELHSYLWRFVRVAFPGAGGDLHDRVDQAVEKLEDDRRSESSREKLEEIREAIHWLWGFWDGNTLIPHRKDSALQEEIQAAFERCLRAVED